jgi:hypothetical protein
MMSQIRYQQQYLQINSRVKLGAGTVATYLARDPITGQRLIQAADGGLQTAQYISNSVPNSVLAVSRSSTIGLPGYISQKPY